MYKQYELSLIDSPPPYKDGIRINTPHYLCKMIAEKGTTRFTLVVSQYEKNNTIHYSLRAHSTCEFSLSKINDPYLKQHDKRVRLHIIIECHSVPLPLLYRM